MAQALRQSELFAGEDWTVVYRAFTEINFNAYDYDTIRSSMVDYIRFNYPEDFNDWIESSEFVAIIDLLSYLGQTLAFRMDINARENFIDTAERRESLLRLARLLSYQTSRNVPARGTAKLVRLQTNEPLLDSLGQSMQNIEVDWNDANNPDWLEQWMLVMNSALITENPFGQPKKSETINGVPTQLYETNSIPTGSGQYRFSSTVDGTNYTFEVVNPDFDTGTTFFEREPDPLYAMHMIYRNDGNGNSSPDTGFFFYFKQGTMGFQDFQIDVPLENRVIDVNATNINQFDVWVQTTNDDGTILKSWSKVPAVVGNNIIYNSLNQSERDIYSIITRDNDEVSLRFADGVFGNVPTGNIRCYYRTSANASYTILPADMQGVTIDIPYFNKDGNRFTLTATFDLQEAIGNSIQAETTEQLRLRAPQVYYTQNRMVNGEDYNVFPLQSTEILKLKAINRVYSGHSRFVDINDPTSTHQDIKVIASDGAVYREANDQYEEIPLSANKSSGQIITTTLFNMMKHMELSNFFYLNYRDIVPNPVSLTWNKSSNATFSTTGYFNKPIAETSPAVDPEDYVTPGTLIEFQNAGWVKVESIFETGNDQFASGKGHVTLSEEVETSDTVIDIFPTFRTELTSTETNAIRDELDSQNTFGLRFDHTAQEWKVITAANLASGSLPFSLTDAGDISLTNLDQSWLIRFDFRTDRWEITTRGVRYIWESEKDVRFFVNQFQKVISNVTGRSTRDKITVFSTEPKPDGSFDPLAEDIVFAINDNFFYEDGYVEPRRVKVIFNDKDTDGVPDDPYIFDKLVTRDVADSLDTYIFHSSLTDEYGYKYFEINNNIIAVADVNTATGIATDTIVWDEASNQFYQYDGAAFVLEADQTLYQVHTGRNGMNFLWNHVSTKDQRIDPAITNVIDIFALTATYDSEYRRWVADTSGTVVEPSAPTTESLRTTFAEFETFKMSSDQIVWRPVKYRPIFGSKASEELQVKFKVIPVAGNEVSDGEIKTRIIQNINGFFNINFWNFGDTFFGSELQAYIHQQMPGIIAGIEIVPMNEESKFGNLQQVKSGSDEIFIPAATVNDIEIVKAFTESVLRVNN